MRQGNSLFSKSLITRKGTNLVKIKRDNLIIKERHNLDTGRYLNLAMKEGHI